MNKILIKWRLTLFAIALLIVLAIIPIFSNSSYNILFDYIKDNRDGFNTTFLRSIFFALVVTIVIITLSFVGALTIRRVQIRSIRGLLLGVLLIPFLLGSTSTAFIFKIIFIKGFPQSAISGVPFYHFLSLVTIQFWQFGFLFLYLFWVNLAGIPKRFYEFAAASRFSYVEKLNNIYIPHSTNLILLLSIFSFIFSFYENAKSQFIFKASQGTNTELITNWLYRNYQSKLLVSPEYAIRETFGLSIYLILALTIILLMVVVVQKFALRKIVKKQLHARRVFQPWKVNKASVKLLSQISSTVFILLVVSPIIYVFISLDISMSGNIARLFTPFTLTIFAAVFATLIALLLALSSRVGWRDKLNEFNKHSVAFFIAIFLLFLVPPIAVLLSGFKWMSYFGYSSVTTVKLAWGIGHSILLLPLLASFLLITHFRVSNNELSYASTISMKASEMFWFSFLKRFKLEYILAIIIAYSFIWNESTINKVFSDRIPSFASDLEMQFIGRGSDYNVALMYLAVSIIVALIGIIIWSVIFNKQIRSSKNEQNYS